MSTIFCKRGKSKQEKQDSKERKEKKKVLKSEAEARATHCSNAHQEYLVRNEWRENNK